MVKWIELGGAKMGALAYASSGSAVLGIRGAGKTVTATYLTFLMLDVPGETH